MDAALRQFYQQTFRAGARKSDGTEPEINSLLPETPAARYLQYQYIAKNPFPVGEKGEMMRADDASDYSRAARDSSIRRCGA